MQSKVILPVTLSHVWMSQNRRNFVPLSPTVGPFPPAVELFAILKFCNTWFHVGVWLGDQGAEPPQLQGFRPQPGPSYCYWRCA
jgi:hypothetical protein